MASQRGMDELIDALKDACADTDEESDEEDGLEAVKEEDLSPTRSDALSSNSLLSAAEVQLPWLAASNFDPSDPIVAALLAEKAAEAAKKTKETRLAEALIKLNRDEAELVNLSGLSAFMDADLPLLLRSVSQNSKCRALIISNTSITTKGVCEHLVPFLAELVSFRVIDFSRCKGVTADAEKALVRSFQKVEPLVVLILCVFLFIKTQKQN